jgi:hypothetical protein
MINLIAGRSIILNLYGAIINARRVCAIGGLFYYTFSWKNIGIKRYSANELIKLDEKALCTNIDIIFSEIFDIPTLDDIIVILLKGKNEINGLYLSYYRAENAITNAKILCYTFNNPYKDYIILNKNNIRLNSRQILDLFAKSKNIIFDTRKLFYMYYI